MSELTKFYLSNLWRWKKDSNSKEITLNTKAPNTDWKNHVNNISWNKEFEQLMKNRLGFGYYRYGANKTGTKDYAPSHPGLVIKSAINRLKRYLKDNNQEHLVDASNLCMIEFRTPSFKNAHMKHQDEHNLHIIT